MMNKPETLPAEFSTTIVNPSDQMKPVANAATVRKDESVDGALLATSGGKGGFASDVLLAKSGKSGGLADDDTALA